MASKSETGHGINVANFKLVIDRCVGYGAKYVPSNDQLSVISLNALWTTGKTAHQQVTAALEASKQPINEREILFAPLSGLVTRVLNMLKSTKASKQVVADAKGLADKIRGIGKKKDKPTEGEPDAESVSSSQMSFVKRAENFLAFIALLGTVTDYVPNELELKTASLGALCAEMLEKNDAIGEILTPLENARITRDHALYDEETGMIDIAAKVKQYVKGVYGARAPEYKSISGIKFVRFK